MRADLLFSHRSILRCALLIVFMAAGCRQVVTVEPTLQPTATYTPRSTPLPTVATPPPPGSEDNPLSLLFLRPSAVSRGAIDNAAEELQTTLTETNNLLVEIDTLDSGAEAVQALCDSPDGPAAAVWVDGVTYAAALAQGCATPELFIEREDGAGAEVVIIVPNNAPIENVNGLAGAQFCRIGADDLYSWIVPSLLMEASSLSPTQLGGIQDMEDAGELVGAVASGDCDAAGIASADLEAVGSSSRVRALPTEVNVPHSILMIPSVVPLGVRQALTDALIAIAENPEQSSLLEPLLGQTRILRVQEGDLDGWDSFIRATGLDFAEMSR